MKSQQIELSELQKWLNETETMYASQPPLKKLTLAASGKFKVYHNDIVIWEGVQAYWAVKKYNEI